MNMLRRILFVVLFLAALIALFFVEENWRGQRAWARARAELEAKGETVDFRKLIPKRPADSENVMKVPPMEAWFIKDRGQTNVPFLASMPGSDRKRRRSDVREEKRYQLGIIRISTDSGERLDGLDRE